MATTSASAANRFGLGAREGELQRIGDDPRGWLRQQLEDPPAATAGMRAMPDSLEYLRRYYAVRRAIGENRNARRKAIAMGQEPGPRHAMLNGAGAALRKSKSQELILRQQAALVAEAPFAERIVRFWSNHFAISIDKGIASLFGAPMEREAIRPHAFGNFADMLLAVEKHPGMLLYLDNVKSVGEGSTLALNMLRRARPDKRKPGINENLAREILELHTLGVDGGYAQADVIEFSRALTGWSVPKRGKIDAIREGDAFRFYPELHEPGRRIVLGKTYGEAGAGQGEAILRALAIHPSTGRHLAFKLARHFVADEPSPALVERMAAAYLGSHGELVPMYLALIDHEHAWSQAARKFKSPDDYVVSALRACGFDSAKDAVVALDVQARLGQPVFEPRSPAGFPDVAANWDGPDALFKRVQAAQALADRMPVARLDPVGLAESALGASLGSETRAALRRAESTRQGAALLLASPAFQWRS